MVIKVGTLYDGKVARYGQCKADLHGWIDIHEFLPIDYDMLEVKTKEGFVKTGWYTGAVWDGCKINEKDQFTHWKRKKELVP